MKEDTLVLFILILNLKIIKADYLKCGEELIENCKECGKGNQSDTCATCEDNYFPLLNNLFCFSCNDPSYGQEGCKGQCTYKLDWTNYLYTNCLDCKEGYYNKNGACLKCGDDDNSKGCSECSYDSQENKFKCLKCSTEEGYRLNTNSRCVKCDDSMPAKCKKCRFSGENGTETECEECTDGYYVDSQKKCSSCDTIPLNGAKCYACTDNISGIKSENCYCSSGYVLEGFSCKSCPYNCDKCELNKETNKTECLRCNAGYYLNNEKQCTYCKLTNCDYCDLDESNKEICLDCGSYKYIPEEKKCLSLLYCSDYEYDNTNKSAVCIECSSTYITSYFLDIETHKCTNPLLSDNNLENCQKYIYDSSNKKFVCKSCSTKSSFWYSYEWHNYTYINNTFQCLLNSDINFYGCEFAEYNKDSKQYECLQCLNYSNERYIQVKADKSCVEKSLANLSINCLESEKIGEQYSCIKCDFYNVLVLDPTTNIKDCYKREENITLCLEGKLEDSNLICTKCVDNAILKDNKCFCNSDSFSKDNITSCFKCNDAKEGNPACDESSGCEYSSFNEIVTCKKCKEGYYEKSEGQCSLCLSSIAHCGKCHYDVDNQIPICDECMNSVYILNTTDNLCLLNDCDEYPEISPGCIICKDKLKDYKDNKKCQRCKYGYFKTKDEKCVYCSSEKYGGIGCHECGYEGSNILCKECYSDFELKTTYTSYYAGDYYSSYYYKPIINDDTKSPSLSNSGKCFDCSIQFGGTCRECQLVNNAGTETLKCISCIEGYYLNPEGICIYIMDIIPIIDNCTEYMFSSKEIKFKISINYYYCLEFKVYNYSNYEIVSQTIYSKGLGDFNKKCLTCIQGYFVNDEGNCEELTYDKCTFNNIKNNYQKMYKICNSFCSSGKVKIALKLSKKVNGFDEFNFDYNSYYSYFNKFDDYFEGCGDIPVCMSRSGEGGKYAPLNLKYCSRAYYYPNNKTYSCISCYSYSYSLDKQTNTCKETFSSTCTIINKGTEARPKYVCDEYYNGDTYALITYDTGEKEYKYNYDYYYFYYNYDLTGCVEAIADTTYYSTKYNCTKCSFGYFPYYSDYYERNICQYLQDDILKQREYYYFNDYDNANRVNANNGVCEKDIYFTPDGEYCYKCDNKTIGMPGCKGSCIYSNQKENSLKCTSGCKTGYIEYFEGVCKKCNYVNSGCYECHYDNNYPNNYKGIKRKRRFVCDFCIEGYTLTISGECSKNSNLGLYDCNKGQVDPKNNDRYICTQCEENYFINEAGECEKCDYDHFKGINKNKCIECGNTADGGVANCLYCESNNEKVTCLECSTGYILSETENVCLIIAKNKELEKFANCDVLTKENGKYVCSKCKYPYTLITKNNNKECIYVKTLYDINFSSNYKKHYYMTNQEIEYYKAYSNFMDKDYIYNRYSEYYPCQEAENLGTDENPSYSCIKCYEAYTGFEPPIKVTELNSKLSFCLYADYKNNKNLYNCLEATLQIKNGKEVFNCTKCKNKYDIVVSEDGNYCKDSPSLYRCLVPFCKTCKLHDGYTCEECISDYEVNTLTGSCIKKSTEIPSIIWKDIYDFKKNATDGPTFNLRGITTSQIYSGHSFLIYLTFKKKQRLRNLEGEKDKIKMNGICNALNEVEKYNNELQLVDYICTGNNTDNINLINYILELIEEGDNQKFLMPSNLEELVNQIKEKENSDEIMILPNVSFFLDTLMRMRTFTVNDEKKFQAEKYKFNFKIDGMLNGNLTDKKPFKGDLDLVEVDKKVNCEFTSETNLNAYLTCDFNAENYKDIKTFSFKMSQISNKDNDIIVSNLDKITLINTEEEKSFFEKNKLIIIIICGCALGAILIGVLIFFIIRKKRANQSNNFINMQESGMKNINISNKPNMPNGITITNMNNVPNMPNMTNAPNMPKKTNAPNMINVPNGQGSNMDKGGLSKTPFTKIHSKKTKDKKKHDKENKIKNKTKDKVKNKNKNKK